MIYFKKSKKKWYIVKILKIEKCPEKNDYLSDNLAKGALMYLQQNYIFQKKKTEKRKKNPSGENLETGATWGLCTPVS